ncbi:MAG: Rieske 2Fe-2S domain-containing protein [Aquisalimonadaceae bacterium]
MLSLEKSKLLTETGPGTPTGEMLRHYWHPVALSAEPLGKPRPIKVLGERLVLYRGEGGQPHLIAERCPHRGTSLAEGRVCGDTIRCCYHGWLFDGKGNCLEQPGEPADSRYASRVKITAYPVLERYGMLWAYLGKGEPPALPAYDILAREDGVTRVARAEVKCNYFQVLENSLDPVHTSILHVDTDLEETYREVPQFECERTELGVRSVTWRAESQYRRKVEVALPTLTRVTLPYMQPAVQMGFWITPADDHNCTMFFSNFLPLEADLDAETIDGKVRRMEFHMFELDPEDRINLSSRVIRQDIYVCESQGSIVDRTQELLGTSDRGVLMLRRAFLEAIDKVRAGEAPPGAAPLEAAGVIHFKEVV